ncbi:PREDICTED: WD repeat-containing protein 47-like [Acropora digitifera]|uniref:WD repeat-containing protein 47-like n=1 Tax=Acropora digitifera TaxID=70779 RepID=UPI00077A02F7|nr:PREDICTED: WD repeat-containing protein 47-like [Acropora digitifera]
MINTSVVVEDHQVVKLILEFLDSRKLHNAMRSLEKEAGIVNSGFSDDILFLRDLVLDGEWEAILIFGRPFEGIDGFDSKRFRYLVLKQKFMEVLYFKSGLGGNSTSYSIEDLIKCLNQLEEDSPNKAEYSKLSWLLTVPNLSEQPEYRDWSPTTARLNCFEELLELLKRVIPIEKKGTNGKSTELFTPIKERLMHLLIKGLCFESCVDYCQLRATNGVVSGDIRVYGGDHILNGPSQQSSGNFLSWLQSLSQDAFITPFEPVNLKVDSKRVKQAYGTLFHVSPKRDDAEILSRSLSLSGRPATGDIVSHLTALETGKNASAILNDRPHSAQPSKEVSTFHDKFQNKKVPEREQSSKVTSNGFHEEEAPKELENKESLQVYMLSPNNYSNNIDQNQQQTSLNDNFDKESNQNLKEIHSLKEQQQQDVLKQLEAHNKQKQELERQLMELSLRETRCGKPNGGELDPDEFQDKRPVSKKYLSHDGDCKEMPTPQGLLENGDCHPQNHNPVEKEKLNHIDKTPGTGHLSKHDSFFVNQAMTSTPAGRVKSKPGDLNLGENKVNATALDMIPVTPAEQTFPVTPLTNGPMALSTGHWVALADGSGVLNTRQVIFFVTTATCQVNKLLCHESLSCVGRVKALYIFHLAHWIEMPVFTFKDKENTSSSVHRQVPVKRGPKVNGVRRALVPQTSAKPKVACVDENGQIKTPNQGIENSAQASSGMIGGVLPGESQKQTPQHQLGQIQQGSSQEVNKVNGQPKGSARTFVVGPTGVGMQTSDVRPLGSEGYIGETQTSDQRNNSEVPKGKQPREIDMTYRKPSTNSPPSNTTVNHGSHVPWVEKLKELSSDTKFYTVATLEDVQAIRAIAFHPSGDLFAIGSNSKALRVCTTEGLTAMHRISRKDSDQPPQPTILFKSNRHHRGSIYCVAWSAAGDIIATGSNDKSIKMTRFDAETCSVTWPGLELAIHNGTVRDLAFVSRASGTPVLVSGGAGDGNIAISDCGTGQTVGQLKGHSGHIMAVYADSDDIIASGSADNTVRLWDLRSQRCIDAIATGDSCVASVCVNSSGNMLASGHEDGSCMIYDITAGRTLQLFSPHTMDCRSVRFSPDNRFLLTGSYDTSIILMDVRKNLDIEIPPYSVVANHRDKVIQCRWHPSLPAFLSSSADKTVTLWAPDD